MVGTMIMVGQVVGKKYESTVRNKFLTVMALWRKDEKRCICCNLLYMQ